MTRAAVATLDVSALRHNLQQVRKIAPSSKVMAVIKANGYGHGLLRVAKALHDADAFAVAHLEEGLALRDAGFQHPITILQGFLDQKELLEFSANNFDAIVHNDVQLQLLNETDLLEPIDVWLKFDTGMHRLGFPVNRVEEVYSMLEALQPKIGDVRCLSHFANADKRHDGKTDDQIRLFHMATRYLTCERSLANSAGLLAWEEAQLDWVRPGIMLYGISPFADTAGEQFDLMPVMTLTGQVIAVNKVEAQDPVGYGGHWRAERETYIGIVGVGYGDGYPRHAENGTPVMINGNRYPLVGRVSMDSLCVDLGPDPIVEIGDEVILWGDGLPVEEIAGHSSTIPYELVCRVTSRVRFIEAPDG